MLAGYLACITGGVVASAVPVTAVWLLAADPDTGLDMLLWIARNICGILLVTTAGLLLFHHLAQPRPRPRLWEGSTLEFVAACLTSVAVYVVVFVLDTPSLLFLVLGVLIWCGVRFGTLMTSLHLLVLGYLAVWATLEGSGPFTESDPMVNALLVQFFVVATAVDGTRPVDRARRAPGPARSSCVEGTREMTDQAQLLNAVVNSMAEGLAVVDDAGQWLLRNPAATRVGGLAGDLRALLSSALRRRRPAGAGARRAAPCATASSVVSGPPGAGRILAVSAAPLPRDSDTGRARALLIFRDATVEHARRVDLTAFAEVVAHDLRNPLAAVESWTEMMAAELEDGEVETGLLEEYIDRVGSGTRRMTALIEDLLGRATQDAALQLRRVDVATLAEEVAADHGATDQVKVGDIPEVRADAALVRQVLDNLLGNALKFVAPGDEPRITVTGRRTDSGTVAIAVADQGVGLPPGADERVFEEHHRAHPSYDGRGLGLAICRRVVERHGGSITARNNPAGRGAVFELTLPSAD